MQNRGFRSNEQSVLRPIGLTALSPTEWRVSDRSANEGDASAPVGFIQRVGDAYEVTDLGRLWERTVFSSFDRAAASLSVRRVRS